MGKKLSGRLEAFETTPGQVVCYYTDTFTTEDAAKFSQWSNERQIELLVLGAEDRVEPIQVHEGDCVILRTHNPMTLNLPALAAWAQRHQASLCVLPPGFPLEHLTAEQLAEMGYARVKGLVLPNGTNMPKGVG